MGDAIETAGAARPEANDADVPDVVGIPEEPPSAEVLAHIARMRVAIDAAQAEADARAAEEAAERAALIPPDAGRSAVSSADLPRPDVAAMLRELLVRNEAEAEASREASEREAARAAEEARQAAEQARSDRERFERIEAALARIEATLLAVESQTRPTRPPV